MTGSLEQWINQIEARRLVREEFSDILAEYFACGFNEDEEIARGAGLPLHELRRLRREFEA